LGTHENDRPRNIGAVAIFSCWLNPRESLNEESSCAAHIRVDRRTDGYHVFVRPRYRWEASKMTADRLAVREYFPVANISVLEK